MDTNFSDATGTPIIASWLNDVNDHVYQGKNFDGIGPLNPREERFGAVGDGVADDTLALQAALDYCLANEVKELHSDATFAINGPLDISNFSNSFTFTVGGLVTTGSFPAVSGNWKTGATPMLRFGNTGGGIVGLKINIGLIDGGGKADAIFITKNGCGASEFNINYLRNVNIGVKMTDNTHPTASNYFQGGYWVNGKQAALVVGGDSICEGTMFDVKFISNFIYGGLNFGDGSQYASVRGQLDFNGAWLSEMGVVSYAGFNIGDQLNNGSGSSAELLAMYTHQGTNFMLAIETNDVSNGSTNFSVGNNFTNGTAVTPITGINTVNQGGNNRFYDIISSLSPSAPFWRATIVAPYLGGIVGSNLWNSTVISGNSNSSFTNWFAGLEIYNSGTILSFADKRKSDASFLDVTDDLFAPKRRLYLANNQMFGLEASAIVPVATPTTLVTLSNGGTHGAVWSYTLQDTTAGIFAKGTVRIAVGGSSGTLLADVTAVNCSVAMSGLNFQVTQGTGASRDIYINVFRLI